MPKANRRLRLREWCAVNYKRGQSGVMSSERTGGVRQDWCHFLYLAVGGRRTAPGGRSETEVKRLVILGVAFWSAGDRRHRRPPAARHTKSQAVTRAIAPYLLSFVRL